MHSSKILLSCIYTKMGTQAWGPSMWTTLHFIALGYPANPSMEDQENYRTFFENLHKFVPCKFCSDHYQQHLLDLPIGPYLNTRNDLFAWTVSLHNIVNQELGKSVWTLEQAYQHYMDLLQYGPENLEAKFSKRASSAFWMGAGSSFVAVALLLIALWALKKAKKI